MQNKKMKETQRSVNQSETARRVLKLIAPYRFLAAISLLSAAVSVLGQLYIPILTGRAIDFMMSGRKLGSVILEIVLIMLAAAFAQWLLGVCNNKITFQISRNLRMRPSPRCRPCRCPIWTRIRPGTW